MPDQPDPLTPPEVDDADRVVGFLARLPRDSVVRRLAMQVVQGRPTETLQPLYDALHDPSTRHWRRRMTAAWALGRDSHGAHDRDETAYKLSEVLEGVHEETFGRRLMRGAGYAAAGTFSLFFLLCLLMGPPRDPSDGMPFIFGSLFVMGLATIPLTFWHARCARDNVRAAVAESLAGMGSVEAIGPLAEALRDGSPQVRGACAASLHVLLPQVTASHLGVLGQESMQHLGRALSHPDGQLVFKVLVALEKAGTSAAIPWVERAALRGRTVRVRDAASHVLEVLRERQARDSQKDILLRPTNGVVDSSLLLRPQTSGADDSAFLLQAANDQG